MTEHHSPGMGSRGVSRPMPLMQNAESDHRREMLAMHHSHTLWVYWTLPILGLWLLVAPFHFGYLDAQQWVEPSGGRGPWFYAEPSEQLLATQAWLMTISDMICGLLLVVLGYRTLQPNRPYSVWGCCFVGMWLTCAPVFFWAPTAAAYVNDTVAGMLLMALTILIPGMPNMIMYMQHGPATPPGWSYNPSSWPQRSILILAGLVGLLVSRYLAVFQLGYIDRVWDPLFGFESGSEKVLNSKMSHAWPVADGGLGAIAYTFEFLMGYMGSPARWRSMPWMVAFFGVLVIPLGLIHIVLVISQPLVVHHWCSMCLLAALIMLPMLPLEVDEVVAMCQHVVQAYRRGDRGGSLWTIFWKGGSAEGCTDQDPAPPMQSFSERPGQVAHASLWGMSWPWTLIAASLLGVLVVCLPAWCGVNIESAAADIAHLAGALVVTVSVVCMGEVLRPGRLLNLVLAATIGIGPWLVSSAPLGYSLVCSTAAVAIGVLSLPRGAITQRYGTWDRFIR